MPSFVSGVGLFFASAACSLICVGLAYWVWSLAHGDQPTTAVLAYDGALLCLVFLFRVIKGPIENNLRKVFTRLQTYKAFEKERAPVVAENKIFVGLLLGYCLLMYLATHSSGLDAYWVP